MPKTFSTAKTKIDEGNKWEDDLPFEMVDIRKIAKGEYKGIRLVGYIEPFMRFWVPIQADQAYDPYKTGAKMYPAICVDFDPIKEEYQGNDCLYRKAHFRYTDPESGNKKWSCLKPTKNYLIFFIDRDMQEERQGIPIKKKYQQPLKFSDIKCATVPTAFAREVQNAIEMYTKKNKVAVDPTDPEKGFDLYFKFDSAAAAEAKYNMMLGDPSPLTKEERKQCELLPESISIYPKDEPEKIASSLARHGYIIVEPGEDPDEVVAAGKSSKSSKSSKPGKSTMKAGAEMLEDDDAEAPPKPKPVVEDDFGDVEDDLGLTESEPAGDSGEEKPEKKKEKKTSKPVVDDDDEFNFDDADFA